MKSNFWKFPSWFLDFGLVFFVLHLFFSFALSSEGLMNVLTFPLMHAMIQWVRSGIDEGPTDLSIGLLMYPTMLLNSMLWTFLAIIIVKFGLNLIRRFRARHRQD